MSTVARPDLILLLGKMAFEYLDSLMTAQLLALSGRKITEDSAYILGEQRFHFEFAK